MIITELYHHNKITPIIANFTVHRIITSKKQVPEDNEMGQDTDIEN